MSEHRMKQELLKAEHVKRLLDSDDDQLVLDCVEGETDLFECAQAVLDAINEDQMLINGIKHHQDDMALRKSRLEHTVDRRKKLLQAMLDKLGLKSVKLPTATLAIRKGVPSVVITDENEIPQAYIVVKPSIDKAALKKVLASQDIPGATLSNLPDTLSIRRK